MPNSKLDKKLDNLLVTVISINLLILLITEDRSKEKKERNIPHFIRGFACLWLQQGNPKSQIGLRTKETSHHAHPHAHHHVIVYDKVSTGKI